MIRWLLVFWMFLLSAVAYLDRVNLSIAGRAVSEEFKLTNVQLGYVFSAFILAYALFQAPGGRLADRFGPRRVLFAGVLWWSVFTALTGWLPSGFSGAMAVLLATRFLLGAGEAVVYPATNRLVARWIPHQERGIANGIIFAGVGVGAGVATPVVTAVLAAHGWRYAFGVCAAIGVLAALGWLVIARDRPEEHPWLPVTEQAHISAGIGVASGSNPRVTWSHIFNNRNVMALTLSYATFGYAAYIFFSWFFIYLNTVRGLDLRASASYAMLPFIAMAVGSPLGGLVGDRLGKLLTPRKGRAIVAFGGLLGAALFIATGIVAQDVGVASVVLAGGAGALYFSLSSFWATTADIGRDSAGAVSGIMNMGNQLAGALTSSLTPVIANRFGWTTSFLVAAALLAVGAVLWVVIDPSETIEPRRA